MGWPSPAESEMQELLSFDEWLLPQKVGHVLVRVTGDAMLDAGIHPGDTIIVHQGKKPVSGDVVLARVDGEWLLRWYQVSAGKPYLAPANHQYELVEPSDTLHVLGVVTAVIRKYY